MNDYIKIMHCPYCNKDVNKNEVHSMHDSGGHLLCNYCNNMIEYIYQTDCSRSIIERGFSNNPYAIDKRNHGKELGND